MTNNLKKTKSGLFITIKSVSHPQAMPPITVESGQTRVFGQETGVDVSLPEGESLLPKHFSISCYEGFCQLTLLDPRGSLLLNNQPITSVRLANHDRIQAGGAIFQISLEDRESLRKTVLSCLQKQVKPLYAIVDAAQDETIFDLLKQYPDTRQQCLFEGQTGKKVATASPYLVQFNSADDPLLEQLVMQGWGKNWCVYINEPESFATIYRHLRQCLRVKGEDGYMLFRFYDPRVFMKMIPSFNPEQVNTFLGPIEFYLIEDPVTQQVMRCQVLNKRMIIQPETEEGYLRVPYRDFPDRTTALHQSPATINRR
ncbi:MAG: DUF4123 domain-containing protein [Methylococcaceae bacterium]|nr:DUF4123 domain-containing protein [Methylococcaceae bacterium]